MDDKEQITKIFSDGLVSGTVTNQKELDEAFMKYPNLSRTYIQTALYWKDVRKWYENYWPQVYKYLDKNFLKKFQMEEEHYARAWEFYLAAVFIEKGLRLEKKIWETGPDFCIRTSEGKKIWVEAISCTSGEVDPVPPKPDLAEGIMYTNICGIEDSNRPRVLRVTNAIAAKFKKYRSYLCDTKSGVSENDSFIIAISGANIEFATNSDMLLERSVFGRGLDVYVKHNGEDRLVGPFYKPAVSVTKNAKNGNEIIPTNFMELDEFSKISAVLYCGHHACDCEPNGYKVGDNFLFAYHVDAKNPLPENFFKYGRGIRKDIITGLITEQKQK